MNNEFESRFILRNKKRLLENPSTKKFSLICDQTPMQLQIIKELRENLERRIQNGEPNLTIRYKNGVPAIVTKTKFQ